MYWAEAGKKKTQKKKLDVAKMRMLRFCWMCGVTKMDGIRNERIRGTTKVGEISNKVQEIRLKWYGHVMRRDEEYVGKSVMMMDVEGRRRKGRLKWSCKCVLEGEGTVAEEMLNHGVWRQLVRYIDPT